MSGLGLWLEHGLWPSPGWDPLGHGDQQPGFQRLSIQVCMPKRIAGGRAGGPGKPQSAAEFQNLHLGLR